VHGEGSSQQKDDQQSDSDVGVQAQEQADTSQNKYDAGSGHGQLVRGHSWRNIAISPTILAGRPASQ